MAASSEGNPVAQTLFDLPVTASSTSGETSLADEVDPSETEKTIRLVIAGSQLISRTGLRALLTSAGGFHVVGEADDAAAALHVVSSRRADALVLDLPPVRDYDFDFLRRIAAESMEIPVLLLVSPFLAIEVLKAVRLGARGVLSKDTATSQDLCEALQSVCAGRYWLGDCCAPSLKQALEFLEGSRNSDASHQRFGLTRRELQVVPLMVQGYSNREIATTLSISIQTVKHHCSNIYDKVGASNRLELALFAIHHQLVNQAVTGMADNLQ